MGYLRDGKDLERVMEISVRSDLEKRPAKACSGGKIFGEQPFFLKIPPMCLSSSTDY